MSSYKDYKKRVLQNPEVKAEYDTERFISYNRNYAGGYKPD